LSGRSSGKRARQERPQSDQLACASPDSICALALQPLLSGWPTPQENTDRLVPSGWRPMPGERSNWPKILGTLALLTVGPSSGSLYAHLTVVPRQLRLSTVSSVKAAEVLTICRACLFSSSRLLRQGNFKVPFLGTIPISASTGRTLIIELKEIRNACNPMVLSSNRSSAAQDVHS
jgi:hypothetical protein